MVNPSALANEQQPRESRLGWKSYAVMAIIAGFAARKHFRGRFYSSQAEQTRSRWFAPSEADLWQERMDEIERKERLRRVQDAFQSRQSSFINIKAARYQKWEEHPQKSQETKDKQKADREEAKEKARLRQHYTILGLDPFREEAFTEDEIKAAFRERALQYHPDRNPDNLDEMREKFRELVDSYAFIKREKNIK